MNENNSILTLITAGLLFILTTCSPIELLILPQTGQRKCYSHADPFSEVPCSETGQDGDWRTGLPWPSPRFTQNENTTITDKLTELVWIPNGNIMPSRDVGWDTDGEDDGAVRWHKAFDYIEKLNSENYLGHNDWRLPNINEIESLVNADVSDIAAWLNTSEFNNVQPQPYWSSTSKAYNGYFAWIVSLKTGRIVVAEKLDDHYFVWPVRNEQSDNSSRLILSTIWWTGQKECYNYSAMEIPCSGTGQDGDIRAGFKWPYPRFTDNGDETVTDNLTELMWTKNTNNAGLCEPGGYTWGEALDYINCLNSNNYLGYNDWRLPNRKEIRSLIDYDALPPLQYNHPFTNLKTGFWDFYWTSTTDASNTSNAYLIKLENAAMISGSKKQYYCRWVWPVRSGFLLSTQD